MSSCIVRSCKNRGKIPGVSYHRIPRAQKDIWLKIIKRSYNFGRRAVICSEHFRRDEIIKYLNRAVLKEGAVPSLNLFNTLEMNQSLQENINPLQLRVPSPSCSPLSISPCEDNIDENDSSCDNDESHPENLDYIDFFHNYNLKIVEPEKLKDIIIVLEKERLVSENGIEHLKGIVCDIPVELRNFAMTLQFYSPKGYEFVRQSLNKCFPPQATIRLWASAFHYKPGFSNECLSVLKEKAITEKLKGKEVLCTLIYNDMPINRGIDYVENSTWGYVDLGTGIVEGDCAKEIFVIMVAALNEPWKLPVAYFFINHMNAEERANIIKESLIRLADAGIRIISISCDGPTVNFNMLKHLGCVVRDIDNIKPYFLHPTKKYDVYVILDVCHLLNLIRNCWASLIVFKDPEGNVIDFNFLKRIECYKQKMKMNIGAQTLSATTLEYLCCDLKIPEFKNAEPTIKFIRMMNKIFDILNSRNPFAKGYKAPLRVSNQSCWKTTLIEAAYFFRNCTDINGLKLCRSPKKSPFIGFVITLKSILFIFEEYVAKENAMLNYILTYKMSQDHLELFFCSIRAQNGWNNNPSCYKFYQTYKKLLTRNNVPGSRNRNKTIQNDTNLLFSISDQINVRNLPSVDIVDINMIRRYNLDMNEDIFQAHNYNLPYNISKLSEYKESIVAYIARYVIKMLKKYIKCSVCVNTTYVSKIRFLGQRQRVNLITPSNDVITICKETEKKLARILYIAGKKVPVDNLKKILVHYICSYFLKKDIFNDLTEHFYDTPFGEELHMRRLTSCIAECYIKIRMQNTI